MEEDLERLFTGIKLNQKETKVLADTKYLARKIGEIEVGEPELLAKVVNLA